MVRVALITGASRGIGAAAALALAEHRYWVVVTSDSRVDLNVAQQALDAAATELGVAAASVDQMYHPTLRGDP